MKVHVGKSKRHTIIPYKDNFNFNPETARRAERGAKRKYPSKYPLPHCTVCKWTSPQFLFRLSTERINYIAKRWCAGDMSGKHKCRRLLVSVCVCVCLTFYWGCFQLLGFNGRWCESKKRCDAGTSLWGVPEPMNEEPIYMNLYFQASIRHISDPRLAKQFRPPLFRSKSHTSQGNCIFTGRL